MREATLCYFARRRLSRVFITALGLKRGADRDTGESANCGKISFSNTRCGFLYNLFLIGKALWSVEIYLPGPVISPLLLVIFLYLQQTNAASTRRNLYRGAVAPAL
jgi:hypothetical protein